MKANYRIAGEPGKRARSLSAALSLLMVGASTWGMASAGLPACDALRDCSRDLAEEMVKCCGWRPETIAQYRRMGTANFEEASNAAAVCKNTFETIAHNARKFNETGKLKELPKSCRKGVGEGVSRP